MLNIFFRVSVVYSVPFFGNSPFDFLVSQIFFLLKDTEHSGFTHGLVGQLTSFVASENHSDSEFTVNEIYFADFNTPPLLGYPVLLSPSVVTLTLKGMWNGYVKRRN